MSEGLSQLYGREGLAIERYIRQREGPGGPVEIPEDCDLCGKALEPSEMAPQDVYWRTPEQVASERTHGVSAITMFAGVTVQEKTVTWYEQAGTYFLCRGCRERLRPRLTRALLFGLLFAALATPLAFMMGGGLNTGFIMVMPGLAFAGGMYYGFRTPFKGFPASSGFRVHRTTFDNRDRSLGVLFAILGVCLFPALGGWFGNNDAPVQFRLAEADGARGNVDRTRKIVEALDKLDAAVPEDRETVGQMILEGWMVQRELKGRRLYERVADYIEAVTETIDTGRAKGVDTKAVIDMMAGDTAAGRLARQHGGDEVKFELLLEDIVKNSKAKPEQVIPALEEQYYAHKALGTDLNLLRMAERLAEESAREPKRKFDALSSDFKSHVASHPEDYR